MDPSPQVSGPTHWATLGGRGPHRHLPPRPRAAGPAEGPGLRRLGQGRGGGRGFEAVGGGTHRNLDPLWESVWWGVEERREGPESRVQSGLGTLGLAAPLCGEGNLRGAKRETNCKPHDPLDAHPPRPLVERLILPSQEPLREEGPSAGTVKHDTLETASDGETRTQNPRRSSWLVSCAGRLSVARRGMSRGKSSLWRPLATPTSLPKRGKDLTYDSGKKKETGKDCRFGFFNRSHTHSPLYPFPSHLRTNNPTVRPRSPVLRTDDPETERPESKGRKFFYLFISTFSSPLSLPRPQSRTGDPHRTVSYRGTFTRTPRRDTGTTRVCSTVGGCRTCVRASTEERPSSTSPT